MRKSHDGPILAFYERNYQSINQHRRILLKLDEFNFILRMLFNRRHWMYSHGTTIPHCI